MSKLFVSNSFNQKQLSILKVFRWIGKTNFTTAHHNEALNTNIVAEMLDFSSIVESFTKELTQS